MEQLENDQFVLLDEQIDSEVRLILADKGKRFTNYIIDLIFNYIILILIFGGIELLISPGFLTELESNGIADRLLSMLCMALIYFVTELSLKGKTIGKFITKTRVVDLEGRTPPPSTLLARSFCRVVPFEPFSFLGNSKTGWHDRWSDTLVIDEYKSNTPV